jgi:hypothetical protein
VSVVTGNTRSVVPQVEIENPGRLTHAFQPTSIGQKLPMRWARFNDWIDLHPVKAGLLSGMVVFVGALILELLVFHWQNETIGFVVFLSVANGLTQYGGAKRRRWRKLERECPMPDLVGSPVSRKGRRSQG